MDFKKLFRKDDKAVSPVIGVILMVAITVILAAAIGSSVFSKGTAQSGPQANLNVKPSSTTTAGVIIEHLGGDDIEFDNSNIAMYIKDTGTKVTFNPVTSGTTLSAGESQDVTITQKIDAGQIVNVKISDKTTNQLICDKDVRFSTDKTATTAATPATPAT
jgi:archaeal type IV pilus assembly protein PilA